MIRFIVSLLLLLGSIAAAFILERGNPLALVGVTALFVEVLIPFFALLAVWRLAEVGRAFADAFTRKADSPTRARSVRVWEFTEKICYAAGFIGLILGVVLSLARISGSLADLGRALAISLMAPLYGIIFAVVCRILRARVER